MNILKTNYRFFFTVAVVFIPALLQAQKLGDAALAEKLRAHVYYLADDKLEGRLTGSKGEQKAADYIADAFKRTGLRPAGNDGSYFQAFTMNRGYSYGKGNSFKVNGKDYKLEEDYYPLALSGNGNASGQVIDAGFGIVSEKNAHDDYKNIKGTAKGKILLIDLSLPDGVHPHSKFLEYKNWRDRLRMAMKYEPAGVIFYNSDEGLSLKAFKAFTHLSTEAIPLVHVTGEVANELKAGDATAEIKVNLVQNSVSGKNVAGYIDNGRPHTIIIGAHYDHLGRGEYGSSLYTGKPAIHNGADDNASGTAALIELARMLRSSQAKDHNYLFIAFSGEELGLLGSNFFTSSKLFSAGNTSAMLNMDMVGRLDSNSRELGINGTGTAAIWDSLINNIDTAAFDIKTTRSGMGNSDHTSFYLANVPAIHFFTGTHPDYHKPSDDAEKLNYAGMADVVQYIYHILIALDDVPKPAFQKTAEAEEKAVPRFKVTLGIIPDYFYDGEGIKIDGVSPGKTAEKAGMLKGDVIVKLGDYDTKDMYSYMEALSKHEKGQKSEAVVMREGKQLTLPVEF